ncbi:MAG: fused response regulator/phosphatase [Gammaproteobacteria bacterium]
MDSAGLLEQEHPRRRALVADDDASIRIVLRSFLRKMGYEVVEAEDGASAVAAFAGQDFDIVFMDVQMPAMDGFEAAEKIRPLAGERFVPLLFLTGAGAEADLARGMLAGGDDYLLKPPDLRLLQLKVRSMERFRELHGQVKRLYAQIDDEHRIAEGVYRRAVTAGNVALEVVHAEVRPAGVFSGDMVLTAYTPGREFHALLGDFSGHGLVAALGALPASEVFRAMSAKGFSPSEILESINTKLYDMLPTGMFMAAHFVAVNHDLDQLAVCNCGMPDLLVLDGETGKIKHKVRSCGLPLGVQRERNFLPLVEHLPIRRGDRVVLTSDGVVEATNLAMEQFDEQRLEQALTEAQATGARPVESLLSALERFCGEAPQRDDISLLEIPCVPELLPAWQLADNAISTRIGPESRLDDLDGEGEFSMTLGGERLRRVNPVPLIINNLQTFTDLGPHRQVIYTLLTELYVNALDYGLLRMDSGLKRDPAGFSTYFREREQRLAKLNDGFIRFSVRYATNSEGGCIRLVVEDSGPGFDFASFVGTETGERRLHGRGIRLLEELCLRVTYHEPGNQVEAVYCWSDLAHDSRH